MCVCGFFLKRGWPSHCVIVPERVSQYFVGLSCEANRGNSVGCGTSRVLGSRVFVRFPLFFDFGGRRCLGFCEAIPCFFGTSSFHCTSHSLPDFCPHTAVFFSKWNSVQPFNHAWQTVREKQHWKKCKLQSQTLPDVLARTLLKLDFIVAPHFLQRGEREHGVVD